MRLGPSLMRRGPSLIRLGQSLIRLGPSLMRLGPSLMRLALRLKHVPPFSFQPYPCLFVLFIETHWEIEKES